MGTMQLSPREIEEYDMKPHGDSYRVHTLDSILRVIQDDQVHLTPFLRTRTLGYPRTLRECRLAVTDSENKKFWMDFLDQCYDDWYDMIAHV